MDEYKKGRDLGTFLRQRVALAFREGENTQASVSRSFDRFHGKGQFLTSASIRQISVIYEIRICILTFRSQILTSVIKCMKVWLVSTAIYIENE